MSSISPCASSACTRSIEVCVLCGLVCDFFAARRIQQFSYTPAMDKLLQDHLNHDEGNPEVGLFSSCVTLLGRLSLASFTCFSSTFAGSSASWTKTNQVRCGFISPACVIAAFCVYRERARDPDQRAARQAFEVLLVFGCIYALR